MQQRNDTGITLSSSTDATDGIKELLNLTHTTSGTPAAGIGTDIAFTVEGPKISILSGERVVLNCMQRMSGIATKTNNYVKILQGTKQGF